MLKLVALSLVVLSASPLAGLAQPSTTRKNCIPLGRVTASADGLYASKTVICQDERLPQDSKGAVGFFCFSLGKVISVLNMDQLAKVCKPSSTRVVSGSPGNRYYRRSRGGEEVATNPALLTPYGNTLLGDRPVFSWSPVPGATHYLLQVRGAGEGWQVKTSSTTAAYPAHQPVLTAGKAYQVSVIAYEGDNAKGDTTRRLNILPTAAAQELSALVQQIHQLGLPEDEKTFLDLNAAYSARGLIDEAIRLLQARIDAGSRHPGIYRALGDNLLTAGLPGQAMAQYEIASDLAESSSNALELNRARRGLQLAALLQQQRESSSP